jgi:hypothetical protein
MLRSNDCQIRFYTARANPAVESHSCEWPFLGDEQKFADKVTHFRSAPKAATA